MSCHNGMPLVFKLNLEKEVTYGKVIIVKVQTTLTIIHNNLEYRRPLVFKTHLKGKLVLVWLIMVEDSPNSLVINHKFL